ncbi:MAG: hypothetical protein PVJ84_22515 [Desulfobacteraceae bacterium]|jgi:hypothetical protein
MSQIDSASSVGESPSGTEQYSVDLGEGSLTISVSSSATASSEAGGATNSESTSEEQSTKDMEGAESDYSNQVPGGPEIDEFETGDIWGEAAEAEGSEIEEIKENIADGLMSIEEHHPGFIEDLMAQIQGAEGEENQETNADTIQEGNVGEGEDSAQEGNAVDNENDAIQGEDAAEEGDTEGGWNQDLIASLEELAASLDEVIGLLDGSATGNADISGGEDVLGPDTTVSFDNDIDVEGGEANGQEAGEAGEESDIDPIEVAEGMAEELGDGEAPQAAVSNPVDTFMEIFEQMSPEAQTEVVQILASGIFGQEGVEAADAVKDDATGEINSSNVVNEVDA